MMFVMVLTEENEKEHADADGNRSQQQPAAVGGGGQQYANTARAIIHAALHKW